MKSDTSHQNVVCSRWQAPHFRPINKFYKSQQHKGKANGSDLVFYAHHSDNPEDILGAVRLVPYDDYFWLRSLYIQEALRGQGIGAKLLDFVQEQIHKRIYCFPYDHLERFYHRNQYRLCTSNQLPEPLEDLYERYQSRGEKIIAMAVGHESIK